MATIDPVLGAWTAWAEQRTRKELSKTATAAAPAEKPKNGKAKFHQN